MYLVIWRYTVNSQHRSEFEAAYNADGKWVALFRRHDGFIRTELLHDSDSEEYVTLDYWENVESYTRYKHKDAAAFQALDDRCEEFTVNETFIGAFTLERTDAHW